MDETYIKVHGKWCYLYRAIDHDGNLVDSLLSEKRNIEAAQRFFKQAVDVVGQAPEQVTTDGHTSSPRAIRETMGSHVQHRMSKYLNNRLEQDHRGDATNEELQIANEEIRTSNEELQSTNEELETSREELQVINEELCTTNQEVQTRNEELKEAQDYAEAIVETVREPLVVLSEDLRVQRANLAFYQFFQVVPQETEGRSLDELGDGQWNSPRLRTLLAQVLTTHHSFRDFEVEHRFPRIGTKTMLLNARRVVREYEQVKDHLLLLAMEDITERREAERQQEALLGMVSHELKNPLTSASLSTQILYRMLVFSQRRKTGVTVSIKYCILLKNRVYLRRSHRYADEFFLSNHVSCSNSRSDHSSIRRATVFRWSCSLSRLCIPLSSLSPQDTLSGDETFIFSVHAFDG